MMATLADHFRQIAERYQFDDEPEPEPVESVENDWCRLCGQLGFVNEDGFCKRCQEDVRRGYVISSKAGRCVTGAERDHGILFHVRMLDENNMPSWTPLCGKAPGRRSAGWSTWRPAGQEVTCPACKRRLERIEL